MPNDIFPAPTFAGCELELVLEEDVDQLIRLAVLAESGLTLAEARAYLAQREKLPS